MAQHYTARRVVGCGWLGRTGVRVSGRTPLAATNGLFNAIRRLDVSCAVALRQLLCLFGSAVVAWSYEREALFGAAAAALMLLFIGIHNSWDSIAYHVFIRRKARRK